LNKVFLEYAGKTRQISFYMWACQKVCQIEEFFYKSDLLQVGSFLMNLFVSTTTLCLFI